MHTYPSQFKSSKAFTLVEVVLSLGIVAFAFVAIIGLIPTGLNTFHAAIDATVASQIVQRVTDEAQQSDFNSLINPNNSTPSPTVASFTRKFDDQGNDVTLNASNSSALYDVNVVVSTAPGTTSPWAPTNTNVAKNNLAQLTIQIAANPGRMPLTADSSTLRWNTTQGVIISTFPAYVARNRNSEP